MSAIEQHLARLRATIPQEDPAQARALQERGARLLDVRPPEEWARGTAPGATLLSRDALELQVEAALPDKEAPVLCLCASGQRSLLAAQALRGLGYRDVRNVAGGLEAWEAAGLPVERPAALDALARERFARHLQMPEVGLEGQRKLLEGRVLCVGAGGLGSPALLYLAAAGVGHLGVVDGDRVDRSNLQRQVLHRDADVGQPKVDSARRALLALWPQLDFQGFPARLDQSNAAQILDRGWDVVLDATDNFKTRYLLHDQCVARGLPYVYGSVFRFEGQASVFWPGAPQPGPCYRCLYPTPPPPELAPSCAQAGVLGVLPGVVGMLQATECIKLLLGLGQPLLGRLLIYDALQASLSSIALRPNPDCPCCGPTHQTQG